MAAVSQPRFTNKVVLVTGASSGFGLALARAFAAADAQVVLSARNPEKLAAAAGNQTAIPCDVSNREQVNALIAGTLAKFGRIDILINNAGSGLIAPIEQVRLADAEALFETNFFGALNCIQAVLPHMQSRRQGHIINMASVAGLRGIPNSSMYCASKAALLALTDTLRIEVARHNIHVTAICPSRTTDTAFLANARTYGDIKLYKVPDTLTTGMVVEAVLKVAAKPKPLVILPGHAKLLHFLNKFFPRIVDRHLAKNMPKLS